MLTISVKFTTAGRLEQLPPSTYKSPDPNNKEDSVLINFTQKNATKKSRQVYLPPDGQDFFLPEVIDNRVKISQAIHRPTFPTAALPIFSLPDVELRIPFDNDERQLHYFTRQNVGQTKTETIGIPVASTGTSANLQIEPAPKGLSTSYVQVISMACQNSGEELFFRASLRPPRYFDSPIIEGFVGDNCKMDRVNDDYRLDLTNELFWNCGVHDCSTDHDRYYCLNIRFPAVRGLRLKEDSRLILRCKTQEKTASHTRRINLKTLDT